MTGPGAVVDYSSDTLSLKTGQPSSSGDVSAVEEFLQLLAKAVRQLRTYPAASPLCVDAIAACHRVLASGEAHDHLTFRVTPHEVLVDDVGIGAGTMVEHELVRRLHRAGVSDLSIERRATVRDLSRFCSDLIGIAEKSERAVTLADLLVEHGVDTIVPQMAYQPEVLDLGAPRQACLDLARREKSRSALTAAGGPVIHLYPRDKGWIRVDPSAEPGAVTLGELAVLVDDPSRLAGMLQRLTNDDGPAPSEPRQDVLAQKYSEVATLFASLDPGLGRLMLAKLARAVLDLPAERRRDLLRRTVLPGLLDAEIDGAVLRDFPDAELVEALGLLLDMDGARPEVLWSALDRLELPADRVGTVSALLEEEIRGRTSGTSSSAAAVSGSAADRYARDLVRVDASGGKSFTDFSAFDLSMDEETCDAIERVPALIGGTDIVSVQLRCLSNLVRHEPNPAVVEGFLARAVSLLAALEAQARWRDVTEHLAGYRALADSLREHRPDVADAIAAALDAYCTGARALKVCDVYEAGGDGRDAANAFVDACGASFAPACIAVLEDAGLQAKARTIVQLMCDNARMLGPGLAEQLGRVRHGTARAIVKVLGFAGPGCEPAIAAQITPDDEHMAREALRALARIGSARAADLVAQQILQGSARVRGAAEEALWHLPPAQAQDRAHELLSQREFVLALPDVAARLLDRASVTGANGFGETLRALASLRFRFWKPALARVGKKAHRLVAT